MSNATYNSGPLSGLTVAEAMNVIEAVKADGVPNPVFRDAERYNTWHDAIRAKRKELGIPAKGRPAKPR